ncbi:MAG: release factor glutamine methyltransferase, partial [Solirubrobacteraceae bacterium]|nr:release factor glutamine methyltransferase [Solirubrobacteraceae bacterium]
MRLLRLPGVHRPRSDTWLLAGALGRERLEGARVVDLCTGTGALAITAARGRAEAVTAVDLTRRGWLAARINAALNGVRVRVRRGDLFEPVGDDRVDVIVTNPPYVPAETDALPRHRAAVALDAGRDGRALIDRICREAPSRLAPGGVILLVQSSVCGIETTCRALRTQGLEVEVVERQRGPLGPILRARAPMLRDRGLLGDR